MTNYSPVDIFLNIERDYSLDAKKNIYSIVDPIVVNVHISTNTYTVETLEIFKTDYKAIDAGLAEGDLYFTLEGKLAIIGPQTGLIANFSRAFSYIRRLF